MQKYCSITCIIQTHMHSFSFWWGKGHFNAALTKKWIDCACNVKVLCYVQLHHHYISVIKLFITATVSAEAVTIKSSCNKSQDFQSLWQIATDSSCMYLFLTYWLPTYWLHTYWLQVVIPIDYIPIDYR
jgi:hypothetical protein